MLSFGEAVRAFYKGYTDFDGRAQRSAYWWVQLYSILSYGVLGTALIMGMGGLSSLNENNSEFGPVAILALLGLLAFILVNILPNIALQVRRFHDLGQTGWLVLVFMLLGWLPLIGTFTAIANIIWFIMPGTHGPNQYGPDPLLSQAEAFD